MDNTNPLEIFDRVMEHIEKLSLKQYKGWFWELDGKGQLVGCCMTGAIALAQDDGVISMMHRKYLFEALQEVCPNRSIAKANDELGWTFEQFREALAESLER